MATPSPVYEAKGTTIAQPSELDAEKRGTDADEADMNRMGKTQVTRRNFKFFSIFGFIMVLVSAWPLRAMQAENSL